MIVWSLFIIDLMGLFFYTKIGSIISIGDLPTTNIIEPKKEAKLLPFYYIGLRFSPEIVSLPSLTRLEIVIVA